MISRTSVLLVFAFLCSSAGASNADQSDVRSPSLTDNDPSVSKVANRSGATGSRSTSANSNRYTDFYLVNDTELYSGDSLSIGQRQFQLSRAGMESAGSVFVRSNLLLLWNTGGNSYELLSIKAIEPGIWKSCWGQNVESVRSCGDNTELIYIFEDENTARDFNRPADDEELAMGPAPEPTQPEPTPEPTQPEPAPQPNQPEPAQPEPAPVPAQPAPAPVPAQPEPKPAQPVDTAEVRCTAPSEALKAALLKSTNDLRSQARQCGTESFSAAGSLVWNNALAVTATRHSNDMASKNFFSHTGSDGLQVWDRALAEGYSYGFIGENIAAGQNTVGVVQDGWINSPGHCRNIMNPQITEMGAACVVNSGSDYGKYWTVVVGRQR